MRQLSHQITLTTRGKGLYSVTRPIASWLSESGIRQGLLTLFIQHTSASLVVQENADPDVPASCSASRTALGKRAATCSCGDERRGISGDISVYSTPDAVCGLPL